MIRTHLGIDNRRHVYTLAALCVLIISLAVWEFAGGSGVAVPAAHTHPSDMHRAVAGSTGEGSNDSREPRLRIDQISQSELFNYSSHGRNVFAGFTRTVPIEAPAAPPRPATVTTITPRANASPQPLIITVAYLGYMQDQDDRANAVLARGDSTLIAKSGDIVFHRYKIGFIQERSIQITDLLDSITQTIQRSQR